MNVKSPVRPRGIGAFPSELAGMLPRDVRFTASGIFVLTIACLLLLAAVTSGIVLSVAVAQARHPRERGSTLARTVAIDVRRGDDHPRRVVRYRFEVDGRPFSGRTNLRERDRRDISDGDPIEVEYETSDPAVNWVTGYEPRAVPAWAIPLISGAFLAAGWVIAWRVRRDWLLLSEGRGALAHVIGQKKVRKDKHTAYRITCSFEDISGATRTMHYDVSKSPPPAGTPITIVYHRDDPRWSHVYPLPFVRPARTRW
jgi:hypothetical protein